VAPFSPLALAPFLLLTASCLGGVMIHVTADYEVNRVDKEVCFLGFDYASAGASNDFSFL
jgi:hypothetical protein